MNGINERVKISDKVSGNIILPEIDLKKYIGKKVKIESVEEFKGQYGFFVKINSEIVGIENDIIVKETNKPLELRASRIFGISEDKDGNLGWNSKTLLGQFLNSMKVKHYKELVGKTVIIQTKITNGKEFLSF